MKLDLDSVIKPRFSSLQAAIRHCSPDPRMQQGLAIFLQAYRSYLRTGFISDSAHQRLISLYCSTNGRLYDAIRELLGIISIKHQSHDCEHSSLLAQLDAYGYTPGLPVFTSDECEHILERTSSLAGKALMPDGTYLDGQRSSLASLSERPVLFNISLAELMQVKSIASLLSRSSIFTEAINSIYPYRMSIVSGRLCFSYPGNSEQKAEAAQSWHFDLDGIGFVKQFIYLNHVDQRNGAHCYIPATHKSGAKSDQLITHGYSRIADQDMSCHQPGSPIQISGSAGTSFLGSTLCWHKGGDVISGYRAMIIIEYSVSRFQLDVRSSISSRLKSKLTGLFAGNG